MAVGLVAASYILGGLLAGGLIGWVFEYYFSILRPWAFSIGLLGGLIAGSFQSLKITKDIEKK